MIVELIIRNIWNINFIISSRGVFCRSDLFFVSKNKFCVCFAARLAWRESKRALAKTV